MSDRAFKVDANAILTLGRNSIKDHTTAVVELIKNAYDADADKVELSIQSKAPNGGLIRIADNGHGMSDRDIENSWLRIGFSEKVSNRTTPNFGRRKTGEKGIGRLSADRLGSLLEVKTKSHASVATGIVVDWTKFEDAGLEVGSIPLKAPDDPRPKIPGVKAPSRTATGTELLIQTLRQRWTPNDIEQLHAELSLLLPPYPELAQNFELKFENDVDEQWKNRSKQSR
jgi:Histidine kinase-, DNA gyrase B-, and HSP90-like ATPase